MMKKLSNFLTLIVLFGLVWLCLTEEVKKKYTEEEIEEMRYLRRREIEARKRRDEEEEQEPQIPVGPKWSLQQLLPSCVELNEYSFDRFFERYQTFFLVFLHGEVQEANIFTIHYERAAKQLKEENVEFPLTYIDCQKDRSVLQRFGVKRYPTIMIFKGSIFERMFYEGVVNEKVLVTIAKKHVEPVVHLQSDEDVLEVKGVTNVTTILYLSSQLPEDARHLYTRRFLTAANQYRALPEVRFAQTEIDPTQSYFYVSDKVGKKVKEKGWGVEVFKGGIDFKVSVVYDSPFSVTDILEFVAHNSFLFVDQMKTNKWTRFVSKNKPIFILWTDPTQPFHERLMPILWEVATQYYDSDILFFWANAESESEGMDRQGLVYDDVPAGLIFDKDTKIYYMDKRKRITVDSLSEFFDEFLSGQLEAGYKPWMSRAAQEKEREYQRKQKEYQKKINEDARKFGAVGGSVAVGPSVE